MAAYLLVRANNLYGSYIEGQTPPLMQAKGATIEPRHVDDGFGAKETLPAFVRVTASDGALSDIEVYVARWVRNVDYQVTSQDQVNEVYRLRIYATNPGDGRGNVARNDLEDFILGWRAVIVSDAANEVVADITIFQALQSVGFWDSPAVTAITFTELDYNQATGDHTIQADYSTTGAKSKNVDELIRRKGGTITLHTGKVITFVINRSSVTQEFKKDLKKVGDTLILNNRFTLSPALVDAAIAGSGASTITLAALQAGVIDESA